MISFLYMKYRMPVMSDGIRSGVNCMRENDRDKDDANDFVRRVLPVPGTSVIIT